MTIGPASRTPGGDGRGGPVEWSLLPLTAGLNGRGHLTVGGCDLLELAAEFETPLFVYDELHLRQRCREAAAAFPGGASYAGKAFLCTAMARLAHEEGLSIDVASAGELMTVRAAGVPAADIIVHGNNKSRDELRLALTERVGRLVVDSLDEVARIEQLVAEGHPAPDVLLRVTPDVDPRTHASISTGQVDSKFGLRLPSAAEEAVARLRSGTVGRLRGLHMHLGSQITDLSVYAKAIRVVAPHARRWAAEELSVGGGVAVAYTAGEASPAVSTWADLVRGACREAGLDVRLRCELGRALVGPAAVTLYTVGSIKHIPGVRTYVVVDGGMADNLRVALYGSRYELLLPRAATAARTATVTVVGKHCESGDVLVRDGRVPSDLRVGDILCTPVTGAYGYSLATPYNRIGRPAVVFARDGAARLVLRRETVEDLLRLDVAIP